MSEPTRCTWRGLAGDPLYEAYHDHEWGVPERDARALWAKLVLDGFQAGLSWITILRKREAFMRAFAGFDPEVVARFGDEDRARLMADAAIRGARMFLDMRDRGEDFSGFLWSFVDGRPVQNSWTGDGDVPAQTPEAAAMAKALKAKGFNFVGPVIVYAFMQAVGMVNDHLVTCYRRPEIERLEK